MYIAGQHTHLHVILILFFRYLADLQCPLTAKLFNLNFHPLEVVSR